MSVYYADDRATVWHGDCLEVLAGLPEACVDSVVTDPPYGIRFMGQAWDGADIEAVSARGRRTTPVPAGVRGPRGGYRSESVEAGRYDQSPGALRAFQEWCAAWAAQCLRVLRPGGHLLAFGGTRTWHRLACGVEEAGFEVRDTIAWLHAQGMPKSSDVARAVTGHVTGAGSSTGADGQEVPLVKEARPWAGWGTGLKPAFEPCLVARRPPEGTIASNTLAHGVGGLNIDACRVPMAQGDADRIDAAHAGMDPTTYQRAPGVSLGLSAQPLPLRPSRAHEAGRWPTDVVLDEAAAQALDAQSGTSVSRPGRPRRAAHGRGWGMTATGSEHDDAGGASRFFPVFRWEPKAPASERPQVGGVAHPTVKPLGLMRWLVRLVTPYGGTVLEPFAGSGTTVEAAVAEGMRCVAVEREERYLPLVRERLARTVDVPMDLWSGGGR